MRERITGLLTSEGVSGPVRTLAVKFVEGAVLSYTDSQRLSCRSPTAEQLCADADKQVCARALGAWLHMRSGSVPLSHGCPC